MEPAVFAPAVEVEVEVEPVLLLAAWTAEAAAAKVTMMVENCISVCE